MDREGIIALVTKPLGFFTLSALIIEASILAVVGLSDVSEGTKFGLLMAALAVLVILIFVVALLAYFRKGALGEEQVAVDSLCYSLGTEIFFAVDGYIQNSEDEAERIEAYQALIQAIESPSDKANREIRAALAEVIIEKIVTTSRGTITLEMLSPSSAREG